MSIDKKIWSRPWGYIESIIITSGVLAYGVILDYTIKLNTPKIQYPLNIILAILYSGALVILFFLSKKKHSLKWFYSIPAAVTSISLFALLSLIMAVVPQDTNSNFIIYRITSSWPYFISYIYLLITLGSIVLKRAIPFRKKNLGFLFNHFGLWLVLLSAGLGSGDIQKFNMYLNENQTVWYAYDEKEQIKELPFAFLLNDFNIEEYDPKLAIIDNKTGKIIKSKGKLLLFELTTKQNITIDNYIIKIRNFFQESGKIGDEFKPVHDIGAPPSAYIEINDGEQKGWISCGSFLMPPHFLKINEAHSIVMVKPEPKRFYSKITIFKKSGGEKFDEIIEVNKPIKIEGWKVYQTSYDEKKGKWSELSILELVRDPWLPLVYAGCIIMIIGAFYLIFTGKRRKND